jgi:phage terminase small subunit
MQKFRKEGIPMAGRKPKPAAVKKLEGNPGKRKLNTEEPIPAKGMPACPDWLMPEAKKEWESLSMRRILCYT